MAPTCPSAPPKSQRPCFNDWFQFSSSANPNHLSVILLSSFTLLSLCSSVYLALALYITPLLLSLSFSCNISPSPTLSTYIPYITNLVSSQPKPGTPQLISSLLSTLLLYINVILPCELLICLLCEVACYVLMRVPFLFNCVPPISLAISSSHHATSRRWRSRWSATTADARLLTSITCSSSISINISSV
jgi:hypothetical protein